MNRYEFLTRLHELLEPRVYLEIGVQTGASMACARPETLCIGVDPHPMPRVPLRSPEPPMIFAMTSDDFFERFFRGEWFGYQSPPLPADLTFIDGMHLVEYALRDFFNAEQVSKPSSVIVFDDVLPYNKHIATRDQPPGDWTGDVWKVIYFLLEYCRDLKLRLVNSQPTGLLVVSNLNPFRDQLASKLIDRYTMEHMNDNVPTQILMRENALDPEWMLNSLAKELNLS